MINKKKKEKEIALLLFGFYLPLLHVSVVKRQKTSNKYRRGFQGGNDSISEVKEEKEEKKELEEELRKKKSKN
jgi:hypothetical protein